MKGPIKQVITIRRPEVGTTRCAWEYVDRNFGDAQGLWTVNPDGTNHAVYWGNNTVSPPAVFNGRVIPGSDKVVCIFGSCHNRPWGSLAIADRSLGIDSKEAVERIWPKSARGLISIYNEVLTLIRTGQAELRNSPQADMPGFQYCAEHQTREAKYRALSERETMRRRAMSEGTRVYDPGLHPSALYDGNETDKNKGDIR